MDQTAADLQRTLLGVRQPVETFDGIQVAKVVSATATDLTFTIPDFDDQVTFGPAPYPHQASVPPVGTTCVVGFVGTGVDAPYVLAFYGWS
jgi:hypothetical protein